ncbi:WXG domain-containing protein [Corynebacterium pseudotuberculosis 1/06-A]|nr:WXG domain-containing protein [Corynebacterium pseudotuberculosis 1/06-A]
MMQRWDASAGKLRMALQSISDNIRSNATSFDQTEADNKAAFASVGAQGLTLITNI